MMLTIGLILVGVILLAGVVYFLLPNLLYRRREIFHADGTVLTFDDGPDPDVTLKVLHLLRKYQQKAIFFLVGEKAERYPEIVEAILADGHEIGIHAYRHQKKIWQSPRAIRDDLERCYSVLCRHTKHVQRLRPPHGLYTWTHIRFMREHDLIPTHWFSLLGDWQIVPIAELIKRYEAVRGDGHVIVLHDGTCGTAEREATLQMPQALKIILSTENGRHQRERSAAK